MTQNSNTQEHTITRDGDRDLEFSGVVIGSGTFGTAGLRFRLLPAVPGVKAG